MDLEKLFEVESSELRDVLSESSKGPLKNIAKAMKLRGYSSKKKNDLVEMIINGIEKKKQLQIKKVIKSRNY